MDKASDSPGGTLRAARAGSGVRLLRPAWVLVLAAAAANAMAHDTWFQRLNVRGGSALLTLGTGNRFPVQESPIGPEQVRLSGCRSDDQRPAALRAVSIATNALVLRALVKDTAAAEPAGDADALPVPVSCWAQLVPFEIELTPDIVKIYLDEIAALPAVREAWAGMRSRGVTWKERYTKHARIELRGRAPASAAPVPTGMGLDALLESGLQPIRPGDALVFQVLRDGRPLPALPVELVGEQGQSGGWRVTDMQGRVRLNAPAPGRWVLRGTELRLSETVRDTWDSRFITLAFEVLAPPARP